MNILSPQLMWINGRCYRINPTIDNLADVPVEKTHAEYIEEGNFFYLENSLFLI